jgi:hypothetical protein
MVTLSINILSKIDLVSKHIAPLIVLLSVFIALGVLRLIV